LSAKNISINSHVFLYVRFLDCAGQVYLCIQNSISRLNKTILFQFFIHYDLAPSTKDDKKKGKPFFPLWTFVWWHGREADCI